MKRTFEVRLELKKDGTIVAEIQDEESGLCKTVNCLFSPDEHPEFDAAIGKELYSWLTLMGDELKLKNNVPTAFDLRAIQMYEPTDVVLNVCWFGEELQLNKRSATAAEWFADWNGECEMCPPNDTPIFTVSAASTDGNPIGMVLNVRNGKGPIFEDLMEAIRPTMIYHHWNSDDEDYIRCGDPDYANEPKYFIGKASALRYIADNDVPYAKAVESICLCKHCGQPVFPAREPGVWGYCHHCDACYAGPADLE